MTTITRIARWTAVAAAAVGYAALAHYTNTAGAHAASLGTLVALTPIGVGAFSMAWHAHHRHIMLMLLGLACVVLAMQWNVLMQHFSRIYWIEHASTQSLLCLVFARTLRGDREPMCTQFARLVHGTLTPAIAHYSRQVTVAWTLFFGAMATVSTLIYLLAPLTTWSIFANFFTAPLIASMFLGEYLIRRLRHPEMETHILDAAKAYWNSPAR